MTVRYNKEDNKLNFYQDSLSQFGFFSLPERVSDILIFMASNNRITVIFMISSP